MLKLAIFVCLVGALSASYIRRNRYDRIYDAGYDNGYDIGYDRRYDSWYDRGYDRGLDFGSDIWPRGSSRSRRHFDSRSRFDDFDRSGSFRRRRVSY